MRPQIGFSNRIKRCNWCPVRTFDFMNGLLPNEGFDVECISLSSVRPLMRYLELTCWDTKADKPDLFNITVRQIISYKTVTSDSLTDTIWHWLLCEGFRLELGEETDKCVLNCLLLKFRGLWLWLLQIEEYLIYAKLCQRWSQVINKRAIDTQHLRMFIPQAERKKFV